MNDTEKSPKVSSLGEACCGCGACAARCPKSCISMEPDACGLLHPVVDVSECVGCGACDVVCSVLSTIDEDRCESALWAKAKDEGLLGRSSSGGVFGLLARDVISRSGVVAGAAWANGCRELRHVVVDEESCLDAVMCSKYVQSSVGREVYEGVCDALRKGRPALFAGTACQVAAMRSYLGKLANSDLFLGVDVICHGVPSPELWRRWLAHVETRERGEVHSVNFRSKITGWLSFSVMYEYITEKDSASRFSANRFADDWYMKAFLANASLRPSCLACLFKRRCGSDVTVGDYWGVQTQHPEVPTDGGVSAVICNTDRGVAAVSRISRDVDSGETSFDKIAPGNPALVRPVKPYADGEAFMKAVAEDTPIDQMMTRWDFEPTLKQKLISKTNDIVKKLLGKSDRV